MKPYLPTALALACILLVISLVVVKQGDNARHGNDVGAIADFSNRLDVARMQIAFGKGTLLTLSNRLDDLSGRLDASQSAALAFSNQLMEAESAVALDAEQITNLNRQLAGAKSENQTLNARVTDLNGQATNQMAVLKSRLAATQASLDRANQDYALLENRLRRDVAERLVVERKFNIPSELQAQLDNLKWSPSRIISADSIYAGLDVEVKSNGFHVISPD